LEESSRSGRFDRGNAATLAELACNWYLGEGVVRLSECIFCAIASGKIPSQTLYSDDQVVAFRDINPAAPVHFLVIPRAHIPTVSDLDSDAGGLLLAIHQVIGMLAQKEGIDRAGFRVVVNNGEGAGQSVGHLHYHVLGGREMGWPPG
jgi:histidine triad (HIT) family protein